MVSIIHGFLLMVLFSMLSGIDLVCSIDPTDGFTPVPLEHEDIVIQKPYDLPLQDRYSFEDGIRTLWVYNNDKPFKPGSDTKPRTEIRIKNHDYSSGVWQFEGEAYVPKGTSGVTIMQIFGGRDSATTLQLRIYDGDMKYYNSNVIETGLYDRWFKLNVIHDVDEGIVTVFIDGAQKFERGDKGPGDLYFKCGVYTAVADSSHYMKSRWNNIKIYKK